MVQGEMNELNVRLGAALHEKLETVFPGGPVLQHYWPVIDARCDAFWHDINRMVALREMSAISGAMRWPWSQEFPIVYERRVRSV